MTRNLAALLGVSLMIASPAMASDLLGRGASTKDAPADASSPVVNWTGFYIGGSLGYGNANHDLNVKDYFRDYCEDDNAINSANFNKFTDDDRDDRNGDLNNAGTLVCTGNGKAVIGGDSRSVANIDGLNSSGLVGDGRIGFDISRGRFLAGVFGSYAFNEMETKASINGLGNAWIESGDEWSLGARAGLIVAPRTLLYALAAYTEGDFEFGASAFGTSVSKEVTFSGLTVGGGIEFALTQNVFLGLEGTHTFYGEEKIADFYDAGDNEGVSLHDEIGVTKVMGTLKIKLNSFGNSGL
jgi:opacity protein-like surface antigen